jgi:hypothetical protein
MNDRIREIAEHCDFYVGNEHYDKSREEQQRLLMARFAELIVRECADQIISKGTDWVDFAPSQTGVRPEYWNMAQQIKQHFGVEE